MRRLATILLITFLCFEIGIVEAEDNDRASECTVETTMEQIGCLQAVLQELNDEINSTYDSYRSTLDQDGRSEIKAVQIAWMKYRDASCRFESSAVEGGSLQPVMILLCQISYTQERISRLEGLLRCDSSGTPGGSCSR